MDPPAGDRGGRIAGRQIRRLVQALDAPTGREDLYLSALAEAQFARRMLLAGCHLEVEARTPSGRHADFRVQAPDARFFVHVKRLTVEPPHTPTPPLPDALRALETVHRPVTLGVRWADAAPEGLTLLAEEAAAFARQASVGDELVVRDEAGRWVGACRLMPQPVPGTHLQVQPGLDPEWDAAVPRAQRLLRRAFSQFMPGAPNVVCIVGDGPGSEQAVETALLGTVVERWDQFPPRGQRVAHGRAEDGFWSRGQYQSSALVAWLPFAGDGPGHVWRRTGHPHDAASAAAEATLHRALGA